MCNLLSGDSHSNRFQRLTKHLLLMFSDAGAIPEMSVKDADHYADLSIFHDIGKRAIPSNILNKPGRLTAEEFAIMKTHTIEGCRLLRADPQLSSREDVTLIFDVCLHHHERWDGGGYPDGLSGRQIAPWVQVVGLADVFDALIHPRAYKDAFHWSQAASMIDMGACGVFAPDMMRCFAVNAGSIYRTVYT